MFGLAALVAVVALTVWAQSPGTRAATAFDGSRAFTDVQAIARAPHPVGTSEHDRVREYLVAELRRLGLDVRVQEGVGVLPLDHDGVVPMGRVRNIVAERPGTAPTGRLVVAAHYDSVPGAPGASDDGAGVATLLEVARRLPESTRNDLAFLLTDGEEAGLLGAAALPPGGRTVVLNNEARGNRGAVMMFRASGDSGPLVDVYGSAAPHPMADSGFAAVLSLLPNNTDFYVFEKNGWLGLDSAYSGGGAYYHTPLDDPAHLSRASLQQMGDNTLAVARVLADADLERLRGGESVHFTIPWLLVRYPAWLELPIALGGLVLAGTLLAVSRRRGLIRLPRTAAAAGLGLVPVLVAGAAGFFLWPLLGMLRLEYAGMFTGDPYRPWPYQGALAALVVALTAAWWALARRITGEREPAVGGVLLVALLGVASAVLLPGGSHTLVWPALFASAGGLAAEAVRSRGTALTPGSAPGATPRFRSVALTLGLVPAAVLLGGGAVLGFDIGLELGGVQAGLYLALFLLLLSPLLQHVRVTAVAVAASTAAAVLLAAGPAVDRFDSEHPRQAHLAYALDTGSGTAVWGEPGATSPDSARYFGEDGYGTRPAPVARLAEPRLTVVRSGPGPGAGRRVVVRLTPSGDAPVVGLSLERAVPVSVDGRALGRRKGFAYHAPPAGGVEVTLDLPAGRSAVRAFQEVYDLSVVPGFRPAPDTAYLRPSAVAFRVHRL
ncbi:aminopeptidase [Streptosporangium pseudovulgare]|uniref:Vacuolar membrane protease n=1 Tax=Streptosporangium pseudovulgare TaxID=35765 RepID=A0ABQ2RFF7_9ACTN|nr:aminopeptidase [Streptosporangium pseudovulgare]